MNKQRPNAEIVEITNDDGSKTWYDIAYSCPNCGKRIRGYASENACDNCGTFYDWGNHKPEIKVVRVIEKW